VSGKHDFPHLLLRGTARERGLQYGRQAQPRIARSIALYREVFGHMARLTWSDAVAAAKVYVPSIESFAPQCMEEMQGIAQGADVALGDILALNARSELMFSATAAGAAAGPGECSSLAVLPEASANGHTLLAQNWDWLPAAAETSVVIEVHRDDGPNYITVAEAGHLAKVGINSAGLGACTNTLVSQCDQGCVGVPYHVLLRKLMDATSISAATRMVLQAQRAFSGNFLLAHRDGLAVNIESSSGGPEGVRTQFATGGLLAHTNHFLDSDLRTGDARVNLHPGTLFRLDVARRGLHGGAVSVDRIKSILRDHKNHPESVCWHPDPAKLPIEQRLTVASVIMDLDAGELLFTAGPPCESDYSSVMLEQSIGYQRPQAGTAVR
jgi:isopenicillin-N N-acyltransferase-like protein